MMGGEGSGGSRKGAGKKRSRVVLQRGMTLSLARIGNDGEALAPLTKVELVSIGGESGHDQQFTLISADETITFFVDPKVTKKNGRRASTRLRKR